MKETVNNLEDVICSLNKMETIAKVLNQTMLEDYDFNAGDSRNLCSVLLREINYTKSKLSKISCG